ncbi:glycosyltransferase family 2 protein [Candidatus Woesearchaeota archaeon]|nr:glycosyltransferase family 2 protein [Candidatus Woesearchaeota archaeon]
METWLVIPAFNEENKLKEVVSNLKRNGYARIVVVDDGSQDNTYQLAQKENVIVLNHLINRGQGAALKTGIDYALEQGAEVIVTFDADGQHQPEDISILIQPILENKADIVLGSRFLTNNSNTPFIRRLFLKGGALLFNLFYGVKVTDSHNGLRALSRTAAEQIEITSDGPEHASEIIEEIGKKQLKYTEVPVTIKYTDYSLQHGQSSWAAFKILFKMLIKGFLR